MESAFAYFERHEATRIVACDAIRAALAFRLAEPSWDTANRELAAEAFAMLDRYAKEVENDRAPRAVMIGAADSFARFTRACLLALLAMDAHRRAKAGTP